MIVVVIIGILAAVALPSYNYSVLKTNRAAAKAQMLDIASRQPQFLIANRAYAIKAQLVDSGYALPTDLLSRYTYDVSVGTGNAPTYIITFTAIGPQLSDGDLTLNSEGVKTPLDKW